MSLSSAERCYLFGPFQLLPAQQLLLNGDTPVRIGKRAFAILTALVERAGQLVTKQELLESAWPRRVVEESNLKVTVASLRRALGERRPGESYLANVSGRGYRFIAPVVCTEARSLASAHRFHAHDLPCPSTRMIGRTELVATLARTLPERRLVSIVGPGGIGKTTVALAVANALADQLEHGARFVDLASVADSRFVPMALARALGVTIQSDNVLPALMMALRDRRLVLVMDSCEHVLATTAAMIDEILSVAPGVLVLATTREPLRIRGETLHRLVPLETPLVTAGLTAAEALSFSAVELFVERASACLESFRLTDADAPVVADICQKLEGIALAIELSATRVDTFTLPELSALLDNQLRLLNLDQRSILSRHSSLAAALDWSHGLLGVEERTVLRRLSVFTGTFTLAAAHAVAGDDCDVVAAVEGLVAKSLVSADVRGAVVQYRLLDTTRAYAAQKLLDSGEGIDVRRRHARHFLDVLTRAEKESTRLGSSEWLADHGGCIDDVRQALTWAYSPEGTRKIGIALTIAAIPLWTQLSLLNECRSNIQQALACDLPNRPLMPAERMKLRAALGVALLYARGPQAEIETHWKEALDLAQQSHDIRCQLQMLWGMSCYLIFVGEYQAARRYLRKLQTVSRRRGDDEDRMSAARLIATTVHYFGGQHRARKRIERVLQNYIAPAQQRHISRFQIDQRGAARGTLANILWLQGYSEQAEQTAWAAVDDARAADHPISLCYPLGFATFPIALYNGDLESAERSLRQLRDHLNQNAFAIWDSLYTCLDGVLKIERDDLTGVKQLRDAHEELRSANFLLRQSYFLCALARGQAKAGRLSDALRTIEDTLLWCERTGERYALPEALRLKGEFVRAAGSGRAARKAENLLRQAIHWARRQGAMAWELRATTSLAEIYMSSDRHDEATAMVCRIRSRFTEGFETADLRKASSLISQ